MDVSARPDPETEPAEAAPTARVDWPDRSHWSEFDLAIEAGRHPGESPEDEPPAEDPARSPSES